MPTEYSILQYCPKPLSGERINFGVVCASDTDVAVRVLSSWTRLKNFSQRDVGFLKAFSTRLQQATRHVHTSPGAVLPAEWTRNDLRRMAETWSNSIQLTEPRTSILEPKALLDSIYETFVSESLKTASPARGRKDAKESLRDSIRHALSLRLSDAATVRTLMRRSSLDGRAESHPFDTIVGNGTPSFVAQALSFEADATLPSEDALRALAFRIEDVKKLHPELPFAVFALPPVSEFHGEQTNERMSRATKILESVDVPIVTEEKFEAWSSALLHSIASHVSA